MNTASIAEIKRELTHKTEQEALDLLLRLARFKKENKELLTYLLFDADNSAMFLSKCREEIDTLFDEINASNFYYIKKSVRKILRLVKKYIRYAQDKEIEIQLLMHFCGKLQSLSPAYDGNPILVNIFDQQTKSIRKAIDTLHEDLQFDYRMTLEELIN